MSGQQKWRDALTLIRSDIERFLEAVNQEGAMQHPHYWRLLLMPELAALTMYRISHYWHMRGANRLATFCYRLNITLTGADIHPATLIGARCLLVHPVGVILFGTLAESVTVYARVIVCADIPHFSHQQAPVIGSRVVLGAMCSVLGPIVIADGVHISPASLIESSIDEPDSMVSRMPGAKPIQRKRVQDEK